jgi:hypothetical protein
MEEKSGMQGGEVAWFPLSMPCTWDASCAHWCVHAGADAELWTNASQNCHAGNNYLSENAENIYVLVSNEDSSCSSSYIDELHEGNLKHKKTFSLT